jgi:ubiquinone/menaquinone biosynthesis C-methylase UbiE
MLIRTAMKLTELSGAFRKFLWRQWYDYLAGYRVQDWQFMNYGFASPGQAAHLALKPADEPDRLSIQLYQHVVEAVCLRGLDVLEVGCGRGGGSSFLARYHDPRQLTGLDYSHKVIGVCRKQHKVAGLTFFQGDAESLPFENSAFDVIINVESSHCYRSMPAFLREVKRVLRPGGKLLWADLRAAKDSAALHEFVAQSGLEVVDQEDITDCVVEALRQDSQRRMDLIARSVTKPLRHMFQEFAAVEGSDIFCAFRDRTAVYLRYVLQRR